MFTQKRHELENNRKVGGARRSSSEKHQKVEGKTADGARGKGKQAGKRMRRRRSRMDTSTILYDVVLLVASTCNYV